MIWLDRVLEGLDSFDLTEEEYQAFVDRVFMRAIGTDYFGSLDELDEIIDSIDYEDIPTHSTKIEPLGMRYRVVSNYEPLPLTTKVNRLGMRYRAVSSYEPLSLKSKIRRLHRERYYIVNQYDELSNINPIEPFTIDFTDTLKNVVNYNEIEAPKVPMIDRVDTLTDIGVDSVDDWKDLGLKPIEPLTIDTNNEDLVYHSIRKQWGGVPRYASFDKSDFKREMYNMQRRNRYHIAKEITYEPYENYKPKIESLNRSLAHLHDTLDGVEYQTIQAFDEEDIESTDGLIYEQFEIYADEVVHSMMTEPQYEAFKEYTSTSNFDDMLEETFIDHGINAFYLLLPILQKFISDEWYLYSSDALKGRLEQKGMVLGVEQVDALQDADKRYIERMDSMDTIKVNFNE